MVRKSSRVPKKRILDGNEEAPLKRQRKKLETQLPEEEFSDPAVLGEPANEHCEKEASELVHDNQCLNRFCEKERLKSNKITGHFQDEKKTLPLTARQRALKISKEGGDPEANCTSFSDASQPVSSKRQKEYLTDAEQAIKKEEAARRRKQQIEKNAKEIQAVAIQKILGQESSRKKREEKQQKQRQEIEKEKQAAAMAPAVNSIRWVMGPSGNMVSFSRDVELPKIFSGPCSYPREREKCAGPSCNNVYRYRDSKTRLPLCSLQCYKAVQGLPSTGPAF
ncbi:hypothetical protein KP509_20G017600 [Ceratopteris richardii]|nr:hypothetical protein KP509_20G017600 [Ceratopteris richardii]